MNIHKKSVKSGHKSPLQIARQLKEKSIRSGLFGSSVAHIFKNCKTLIYRMIVSLLAVMKQMMRCLSLISQIYKQTLEINLVRVFIH